LGSQHNREDCLNTNASLGVVRGFDFARERKNLFTACKLVGCGRESREKEVDLVPEIGRFRRWTVRIHTQASVRGQTFNSNERLRCVLTSCPPQLSNLVIYYLNRSKEVSSDYCIRSSGRSQRINRLYYLPPIHLAFFFWLGDSPRRTTRPLLQAVWLLKSAGFSGCDPLVPKTKALEVKPFRSLATTSSHHSRTSVAHPSSTLLDHFTARPLFSSSCCCCRPSSSSSPSV
jgi:hypothetical protein